MRPTNCYEPLHGDGEGHVGRGAEGDCGHGVEDVYINTGEELGLSKPLTDQPKGGICMDRDIEDDVPGLE